MRDQGHEFVCDGQLSVNTFPTWHVLGGNLIDIQLLAELDVGSFARADQEASAGGLDELF